MGDGLFALGELRARGGHFGIGSDSHMGLDPREELRWLRIPTLATGRRTVLGDVTHPDVATNLWLEASTGGAQACGAAIAGLQVGGDASWLVLDDNDPALAGCSVGTVMGSWLFAPARHAPTSVGAGGRLLAVPGTPCQASRVRPGLSQGRHHMGRHSADSVT